MAQNHTHIIRKTTFRASEACLVGYKPTYLQLGALVGYLHVWFATFGWTTRIQMAGLPRVALDYVCSSQGKASMSFCFCEDCDVGLCVSQHATLSVTTDLD